MFLLHFILISFLFQGCVNPHSSPNIVLILVDDLGIKDLGCYGQEYIETPNIDRLASEGMHWENAYSSCPVEEITIAEALKPAGYASGSFGKWHVGFEGFWPEDQGFDVNVAGWTHGSPPDYFQPENNIDFSNKK